MAEAAGYKRKKDQDEPARLDGSKRKSSEDEPARLNQGITVEKARWEVTKLEAKSTYDVFLCSKPDCNEFVDVLYRRLINDGIRVWKDDGLVDTSKKKGFPQPVYNSKIYMPIFSKDYAGSSRFLDTLAVMVEYTSRSGGKEEILPVFLGWGPSDEKLEMTTLYRATLNTHTEKADRWKKALVKAGKVQRWKLSSNDIESIWELVTDMVARVLFRLMTEHNDGFKDLSTGDNRKLSQGTSELEDSQESKIMELLELDVNDVRIVGIHGKDGIGKTTLAKIVYDQISHRFDASSFLVEIKETKQQPGGVQHLQTKLIFDILKKEHEVVSAFEGVQFLKELFRNMKVLIVLDDMEGESLLEEFVGANLDWFGSGSRIVVTSKESRVFQGFAARGLAYSYHVNPMDDKLAFDLFWQYAIGRSYELRSYVKIAITILKAAKGLPLLLKVYGSYLRKKCLEEWSKFEDVIQYFQEDYQKILRAIFYTLDEKQKQIYLDIARFPLDVDCRIASYMLHHFIYHNDAIEVLHHMFLIKIEENKLGMHSLLRCLAREIIQEGLLDPGTVFGLHIPAIAQDTNKGKMGKDHLNTEEAGFDILPNTVFLSLGCANVGEQLADALSKVRWLHWQGCNQDAISIHLEKNENLVILDLSWSKVTESWEGWKKIKMESLKVLNLTGCANLLVTPSFSCYPKLEILILERCSQLVYLDPSVNDLKLLVTLNLKFCSELSMLPLEMDGMNALKELLIDGTSIRELPASIGKLVQLQNLSATNCLSLVRIPGSVCGLEALSVPLLDNAKLLELPESIGGLKQLERLSLRGCRRLGKLPESIGELSWLVELDISGTGISILPDSTGRLWSLVVLKLDFCFVKELPLIGELRCLREFHASWCRSLEESIPISGRLERVNGWSIFKSQSLRELRLRGTRISSLPSEIESMFSLETLDLLHCNNLTNLPCRPPRNLSNLYVNPALKQKMLKSLKFCCWRPLLE